jgi:predicted DNA-binding protein (MmcQ/YjbR family)
MAKKKSSKAATLQEFCRALPGATEDIKWGADLVFSVGKKMFAAFSLDKGFPVGCKCTDLDFDRLVKQPGIIPAPYAARFGWVSMTNEKALGVKEAQALLRRSYELVLEGLPRKAREAIGGGPSSASPAGRGRSTTRR